MKQPPISSVICYCTDCRKACGAQSVAWITTSLTDMTFIHDLPREIQSSPGVTRTFCDHCGTSLTYTNVKRPNKIDITTASLDNPQMFPPNELVCTSKKLSWDLCLNKPIILDEP